MKKNIFALLFFVITINSISLTARVSLGTSTPDKSAMLDLVSDTKGFLPPRLTTLERDNIMNPAEGLLIFNKSVNSSCIQHYKTTPNGSGWSDIFCYNKVNNITENASSIFLIINLNFFKMLLTAHLLQQMKIL